MDEIKDEYLDLLMEKDQLEYQIKRYKKFCAAHFGDLEIKLMKLKMEAAILEKTIVYSLDGVNTKDEINQLVEGDVASYKRDYNQKVKDVEAKKALISDENNEDTVQIPVIDVNLSHEKMLKAIGRLEKEIEELKQTEAYQCYFMINDGDAVYDIELDLKQEIEAYTNRIARLNALIKK